MADGCLGEQVSQVCPTTTLQMEEEEEDEDEGRRRPSPSLPLLSLHVPSFTPGHHLPGRLWGRPGAAGLTPAGFLLFPPLTVAGAPVPVGGQGLSSRILLWALGPGGSGRGGQAEKPSSAFSPRAGPPPPKHSLPNSVVGVGLSEFPEIATQQTHRQTGGYFVQQQIGNRVCGPGLPAGPHSIPGRYKPRAEMPPELSARENAETAGADGQRAQGNRRRGERHQRLPSLAAASGPRQGPVTGSDWPGAGE